MVENNLIKVAVTDDDDMMRYILTSGLVNGGFNVVFNARNGADLITKLEMLPETDRPNVCIMDVEMPIMDGIMATHEVKLRWPDIQIIGHTSNDDEYTLSQMLKHGANSYLLKGTSMDEIRNAVRYVANNGYYFNALVSGYLLKYLRSGSAA